jgi:hypothetical protein
MADAEPLPLVEVCSEAETRILAGVEEVVQRRAEVLGASRGQSFRTIAPHHFSLEGRQFEVRVAQDPLDASVVNIGLTPVGIRAQRTRKP